MESDSLTVVSLLVSLAACFLLKAQMYRWGSTSSRTHDDVIRRCVSIVLPVHKPLNHCIAVLFPVDYLAYRWCYLQNTFVVYMYTLLYYKSITLSKKLIYCLSNKYRAVSVNCQHTSSIMQHAYTAADWCKQELVVMTPVYIATHPAHWSCLSYGLSYGLS